MALFIYEKNYNWHKEIFDKANGKTIKYYSSGEKIQEEYCSCIEREVNYDIPFFENANVKQYLKDNGVEYVGNYLLKSKDWNPEKQFVTWLNYSLQMSCIMLYYQQLIHVIDDSFLFDCEYLLPVLKKMDIYLVVDFYESYLDPDFADLAENGVEIVLNGQSLKNMNGDEVTSYFHEIYTSTGYLNREVDAKYFPENFCESTICKSDKIKYNDYLLENSNFEREKEEVANIIKENPEYRNNIYVQVNGENRFTGCFRRYPIHYLYEIGGEWKYICHNSVKNPSLLELFDEIFFENERTKDGKQIDVSNAERLMVLVLDCNETCDAREYWKHVAFVAKYDKDKGIIEICDMEKGILEFHELLQKSKDLV